MFEKSIICDYDHFHIIECSNYYYYYCCYCSAAIKFQSCIFSWNILVYTHEWLCNVFSCGVDALKPVTVSHIFCSCTFDIASYVSSKKKCVCATGEQRSTQFTVSICRENWMEFDLTLCVFGIQFPCAYVCWQTGLPYLSTSDYVTLKFHLFDIDIVCTAITPTHFPFE